jgi:hypothetical protein
MLPVRTAIDRRSPEDEKQSSNDYGSEGWKIGNGDAVGGAKYEQNGSFNRAIDENPDYGGCDEADRQPPSMG